jgi:hypothetical protein
MGQVREEHNGIEGTDAAAAASEPRADLQTTGGKAQMNASNDKDAKLDAASILELDAYSEDDQFIGRVSGFLPTTPESELGVQRGHYDPVDAEGRIEGKRHVVIDGTGTIIQSMLIVKVDSLEIDLRGRRVTVPLSVHQIEAMPHHDPDLAESEDLLPQ